MKKNKERDEVLKQIMHEVAHIERQRLVLWLVLSGIVGLSLCLVAFYEYLNALANLRSAGFFELVDTWEHDWWLTDGEIKEAVSAVWFDLEKGSVVVFFVSVISILVLIKIELSRHIKERKKEQDKYLH